MHNMNPSVWIRAFPLMLTDNALIFFETAIAPKFDVELMPYEQLITDFRKGYSTPEQRLKLMDDWNSLSFSTISQTFRWIALK